jgi:hypothetical protein
MQFDFNTKNSNSCEGHTVSGYVTNNKQYEQDNHI